MDLKSSPYNCTHAAAHQHGVKILFAVIPVIQGIHFVGTRRYSTYRARTIMIQVYLGFSGMTQSGSRWLLSFEYTWMILDLAIALS